MRLDRTDERLSAAIRRGLETRGLAVAAAGGRLDALSPLAVLGRGYSITRREVDDAILKSSREIEVGSSIRVQLWRGSLRATVSDRTEEE
jgi:exodeoxyribonuclease VII large subunit